METVKIGDICDVLNGYAFKSSEYTDSGIRIIRISNVQKGYIEDKEPAFYPLDTPYIEKYKLKEGDLLISLTGNVGRVGILPKEMLPAALNQRVACLRIKDNRISKGYLYHLLNSDFFEKRCINSSKGIAQKNMSTEWLKEYEIPLCSMAEQSDIVRNLDLIGNVISDKKEEINELETLIKSRFVEMFGDPVKNIKGYNKQPLSKYAKVIVGYPFPSEDYADKGIKIVGGYNLMQGYIDWNNSKFWPNSVGYEQYLLQSGDIVIAMDRPWVNEGFKIAKINENNLPAILIQRTACVRPIDINEDFIYALLDSIWFKDHCTVTGSLVPHISNRDINSYEIIVPSMNEQNQFSDFVHQVDKSKLAIQKSLDETQLLFDSLMQKYFG